MTAQATELSPSVAGSGDASPEPATPGRPAPQSAVRPNTIALGRGNGKAVALALMPAAVLFTVFYAAPMATVIVTAFSNWSFVGLDWVGMDNFQSLWSDPAFWAATRNTAKYTLAALVIQVPLGVTCGIILAQHPRGWSVFRIVLLMPIVISGAAFGLVFQLFYQPEYGLLDGLLGLVGSGLERNILFDIDLAFFAVTATWVFIVGLFMILTMAEVASIPNELYEAARVDGASQFQTTWYITLPQLRQVIATCCLLSLLATLRLFDVVLILTQGGPGNRTSTLGTFAYSRYLDGQWGYANAVGVATIIFGVLAIVVVARATRAGATT